MNDDLRDLFRLLKSHDVEFVVIGAHAVSFHSRPRMTEDIDLFLSRTEDNANRLAAALEEFGFGIGLDVAKRFAELDRQMIVLGHPPYQVDLLNFAGTRPFETIWDNRVSGKLDGVDVWFASKDDLIEMKQVSGRPQDLADLDRLMKF